MISLNVLALSCALVQPVAGDGSRAIVDANFPAELAAKEAAYAEAKVPTMRWSHHVVKVNDDGSRRIFAAYSNEHECAVRLIDVAADGAVAVGPATLAEEFEGESPVVQLIDVTGDKLPEVVVTLPEPPMVTTWLFSVTGNRLAGMNPDENGKPLAFGELTFVDVDGDGVQELLQRAYFYKVLADGDGPRRTESWDMFKLAGGNYALTDDCIVYGTRFSRPSSASTVMHREFSSDGEIDVDVLVLNGGLGRQRASTANVKLNGETIIAPSHLNANVRSVSAAAKLRRDNVLDVSVGGAPDSELTLIFRCPGK